MRIGLRGAATVSVEGKEVVGGGWINVAKDVAMEEERGLKELVGWGMLALCNTISVQMKRMPPCLGKEVLGTWNATHRSIGVRAAPSPPNKEKGKWE